MSRPPASTRQARREFWELIQDLAAGGTTILLTTHYLDEAETLADRVGVIARGRLVAVATPATLGSLGSAAAKVRWAAPDGPQEHDTDTRASWLLVSTSWLVTITDWVQS
jgi:ABC-2 type transport system ATP-binding protein